MKMDGRTKKVEGIIVMQAHKQAGNKEEGTHRSNQPFKYNARDFNTKIFNLILFSFCRLATAGEQTDGRTCPVDSRDNRTNIQKIIMNELVSKSGEKYEASLNLKKKKNLTNDLECQQNERWTETGKISRRSKKIWTTRGAKKKVLPSHNEYFFVDVLPCRLLPVCECGCE